MKIINKIKHWWERKTRKLFLPGYVLQCHCGYSRGAVYDVEDFCCPKCGRRMFVTTYKKLEEAQLYRIKHYLYTVTYASNEVF